VLPYGAPVDLIFETDTKELSRVNDLPFGSVPLPKSDVQQIYALLFHAFLPRRR
jgi:hypothetical protein